MKNEIAQALVILSEGTGSQPRTSYEVEGPAVLPERTERKAILERLKI
jgi:hypothetical protein